MLSGAGRVAKNGQLIVTTKNVPATPLQLVAALLTVTLSGVMMFAVTQLAAVLTA